jgi:hypothetical protein
MSDGAGGRRVEAASTAKGQILQRSKQKGIYLPPVDAAPLCVAWGFGAGVGVRERCRPAGESG